MRARQYTAMRRWAAPGRATSSGRERPAPRPDGAAPATEALVDPPQHGAVELPGEARAQNVLRSGPAECAVVLEILTLLEIEVAHRERPGLHGHHLVVQAAVEMGVDLDRRDQTHAQKLEQERRGVVAGELVALGQPADVVGRMHIRLTAWQAQLLDGALVIPDPVEDMRSVAMGSDVRSA